MSDYSAFLSRKATALEGSGFEVPELNPMLFPFQRDIVSWTLKMGRSAIFAECGMGKTPMQLEWAHRVCEHTGRPVLILAPLAVAQQTIREGKKFGIEAVYSRTGEEREGITVTNYEMLDRFDADAYGGIVLDESSILKAYDGKTRNAIIGAFSRVPYRLACTATPAPNDFMELGNHSEFLGYMNRTGMLSMFFIHDGGETQTWRLKRHAISEFWRWVGSWAVTIRRPSDLGYEDEGFALPPLEMHEAVLDADNSGAESAGMLFELDALTLTEQRAVKRASLDARCEEAARLASDGQPWIVWCELNDEGDALEKLIPGAVQVAGADSLDDKESKLLGFIDGKYRVLVTKPSIAGHGLNLQHCANVCFVSISHSFEQTYQAIRRCYRYGQTRPVNVYFVRAHAEGAIASNLARKEEEAAEMATRMMEHEQLRVSRGTRHLTIQPQAAPRVPSWVSA